MDNHQTKYEKKINQLTGILQKNKIPVSGQDYTVFILALNIHDDAQCQ